MKSLHLKPVGWEGRYPLSALLCGVTGKCLGKPACLLVRSRQHSFAGSRIQLFKSAYRAPRTCQVHPSGSAAAVNQRNQAPAFVKANGSTQVSKHTGSGTVGGVSVMKESKLG